MAQQRTRVALLTAFRVSTTCPYFELDVMRCSKLKAEEMNSSHKFWRRFERLCRRKTNKRLISYLCRHLEYEIGRQHASRTCPTVVTVNRTTVFAKGSKRLGTTAEPLENASRFTS